MTQTEVERYVRERVAATGRPFLVAAPGRAPWLSAVRLFDVGLAEERDSFTLIAPTASDSDVAARWARATLWALTAVSEWVPEPPDGAAYVYEEGAMEVVRRVEATALGLSLLQLALNRSGSGIVIEVVT